MFSSASDISKNQEILNEYRTYRKFLTAVAPPEWREEQKQNREERRRMKLMEGKDNSFICDYLSISINTLKKHILNIYRKLGIRNRVQLFKKIREKE